MTANDAVMLLWKATLATSAASLLLLLLPALLRRRFGAGVAYAAWWLLPAALAAVWLPAMLPAMRFDDVGAAPAIVTWAPPATTAAVTHALARVVAAPADIPQSTLPWRAILLALWACGALATGLWLWRCQRGFVRALGPLSRQGDGLWRAQARVGLPALLGVAPARIVLPDDFESRYDARERALMLAHERAHARRGDHIANLVAACLRALFWFNPLVLSALARFRYDQELACDQAVLLAHPDSRRAYGEAMLKTLMADRLAPLGCHWGLSNPMKDRLMQLKRDIPRGNVRWIGASLVGAMAVVTAWAVWAAQPADPPASSAAPATQDESGTPVVARPSLDGAYVRTRLLDASSGRALRETTYWLAPSMQIPGSMYPAPANTTARLTYAAERAAGGAMRVRVSLGGDDAPDAARAAGGSTMYMPADVGAVSRREALIDHGRTRVQFEVWRAANPCGKPISVTVKTPEDQAFACSGQVLGELLTRQMVGNGALDALPPSAEAQAGMRAGWKQETVLVNVLVSREGRVVDVKPVDPATSADTIDSLRSGLMNTSFPPSVANGQPLEAWRQVSVETQDYAPAAVR